MNNFYYFCSADTAGAAPVNDVYRATGTGRPRTDTDTTDIS
ncbi:MAG: hypothetical protein ACI3YB_04955 [Prevotella sp.]